MKKFMFCLICQIFLVSFVFASWNQLSSMSVSRDSFGAASIGDEIYCFGGNSNPEQLNLGIGEKYSCSTTTWQSIANHPDYFDGTGVEEICGIGFNDKFYVFGAWGDDPDDSYNSKNLSFNQVYDPTTYSWTKLLGRPISSANAGIAEYGNKIYLFGGTENRTRVDAYDPATDSWVMVTNMPKSLDKSAVVVYQDKAYVIAGYDHSIGDFNNTVLVYDFITGVWDSSYAQIPSGMVRAFSSGSVTPVVDGRVYLTGGFTLGASGLVSSNKVTVFDLLSKEWFSLEELPEARANHCTVLCGEMLYVLGGFEIDEAINRCKDTVFVYNLNSLPDFDDDSDVDLRDFADFASKWLRSDCVEPDWCDGADIDMSGDVGVSDLIVVVDKWLDGTELSIDLSGEYWFGSLSADVDTNIPWSKIGTVEISGGNWSQQWDDYDGNHTRSFDFITEIQSDGSINLISVDGTYNIAWNGNVIMHADTEPDASGQLGIDMYIRKSSKLTMQEFIGDYGIFAHWLGRSSRFDDVRFGDAQFSPDKTYFYDWVDADGIDESGSGEWMLDVPNKLVTFLGLTEPLCFGHGGVHISWSISDSAGYIMYIEEDEQAISIDDVAGDYLVRFIESGPEGEPYTCGEGTCVIGIDGSFTVDANYSDGEHDRFSTVCSISDEGKLLVGEDGSLRAIVSLDKKLILIPEMSYEDPELRTEDDWLGGIFLIKTEFKVSEENISDHVFKFDISYGYDYESPGDEFNPGHEFEMSVATDETVERVEFVTPTGSQYEFTSYSHEINTAFGLIETDRGYNEEAGLYEWEFDANSRFADGLADFSDGEYTFTVYYTSGRSDETVILFGLAGAEFSQPIQEPMINSFEHLGIVNSPVIISWDACSDTAVTLIYSELTNLDTDEELDDYSLSPSATELPDGSLLLENGNWEIELEFDNYHSGVNADGINFIIGKYSQSDYFFTVEEAVQENISDHVFDVDISYGYAYNEPDDDFDSEYEFEIAVVTDDTVERIEFMTPTGSQYEFTNYIQEIDTDFGIIETDLDYDALTGMYRWGFCADSDMVDGLAEFSDGEYTFTVYYENGSSNQTVVLFGLEGAEFPQPTQEPMINSFEHWDVVSSPVVISWDACSDTAVTSIYCAVISFDTDEDFEEFSLSHDATGLPSGAVSLENGDWEFELVFNNYHSGVNADGINFVIGKYSYSGYFFMVE